MPTTRPRITSRVGIVREVSMVLANHASGRIAFTTDAATAIEHGEIVFIAVGTPPDEDGSADLQYVLAAARNIGRHMDGYKVVVDKSTVPVGTADQVRGAIAAALAERGAAIDFAVVSNPEFLKEGAAVDDFMRPDRIVVGADDERAIRVMRDLYAPFQRNHDKLVVMDVRSAELTKYAANAMLATRISFMNELALLAEKLGADIEREFVQSGKLSWDSIGKYAEQTLRQAVYESLLKKPIQIIIDGVFGNLEKLKTVLGNVLGGSLGKVLGAAGVQHVYDRFGVMRRNLDRRVGRTGRGPADQQRDGEAGALHFLGHRHHFV